MITIQETQALRGLLAQLTQVQGITRDPQAAAMIAAAFSQQPDAGYLLVQRAMLLDQALANARAEIEQLQNQLQAEREQSRTGSGGGFLDPASSWGRSGSDLTRSAGASGLAGRSELGAGVSQRLDSRMDPRHEPAAPYTSPQPPAARPGLFGGGGGFLGNMAATAAGVAGGAFLFQGLGSLLGHHGSGLLGGHGGAQPVDNTTVNNFYDTAPQAAAGDAGRLGIANSGTDGGNLSEGLDNGIDDVVGNDDFGSGDDSTSI